MGDTVIAWINLAVLVSSSLLVLYFYVKSAGPAALEAKVGPKAYKRCTRYRFLAGGFMGIASFSYVIYFFYPLPTPLPRAFPWSWWISAMIAVIIAIPSGYLWYRGMKDAGEETMFVKKDHQLYGGIYEKMRHPQAVGEVPFWWVMAFALHSPFLVLYSFVWLPIFLVMCLAEERDLVLRYGPAYEQYQQRVGFLVPKRSNR